MDTKEITLYTKVYIVKAMVFSVVMYEYESWTIKKVVKAKSFSCARLSVTPWTIAYEVPPSMEFSRQEYWSGLSFPSPGDLPNLGIEPRSPSLQVDSLPAKPCKRSPRILEWVAYSFSNGSSRPRNRTRVSCIAGRFFTN